MVNPFVSPAREIDAMVNLTFIEHDGTRHTVDVTAGISLMEAAVTNGVPGIDADCGGSCACATCHVLVERAWTGKLGEMAINENDMLDFVRARMPNSRLSCQIKINSDMDGLTVQMPESQR